MTSDCLDESQIHAFNETGFVIVRNFIPKGAAATLRAIAGEADALADNAYVRTDASGRQSKVTLWYEPGDDVFGRLSCSARMVNEMSALLGGEACFFHAKLMQKEPASGGAWEWHQDYGYWYDDGFLSSAMGSCYVALDAATKENGCLQVIPASHHYGRLRHVAAGEQRGAEAARVQIIREKLGVVHCELEAGDALYFHSNLLHASAPNLSSHSRWGLISCFFRSDNESMVEDPRFRKKQTPIVAHDEILHGRETSSTEKSYLAL